MWWPRSYRKWCCRFWRFQPYYVHPPFLYPPLAPFSIEEEIAALEDYKKHLEKERASIEEEIKEVEARIKELKNILEGMKKP